MKRGVNGIAPVSGAGSEVGAFRPLRTGDEPLFVVQSPFGPLAAVPAQPDEETAVDLELLFNATLQSPDAINNLFTTQK